MKIDVERLKARVDILELAKRDVKLRVVTKTNGGEWAGPCPFCGGTDRFRVWPARGRFWCRVCDRKGDVLEYVAARNNLDLRNGDDFARACELLGGHVERYQQPSPKRHHPTFPTARPQPPASAWQAKAQKVIETCEAALWQPAGQKARDWLHTRGLNDETLKHWRIGYVPGTSSKSLHGLSVPSGIVIPGIVSGDVWYIKVRRRDRVARYSQVNGSRPALYMADNLTNRTTVVLTEGEFDALVLWQEAHDLAGVATLGSASATWDKAVWGKYLSRADSLLLAYDTDDAGRKGVMKLARAIAGARPVEVPSVRPGDKDITDFHRHGGRLRDWLIYQLAQVKLHPGIARPPREQVVVQQAGS